MLAADFIAKWRTAELTERAAAQSHFRDLCDLLGEETPTDADPKGEWYAFEKGATKTTGGDGWADVWKRGCFGWEYKSRGKDLRAAFAQLQRYAPALENPPLLVVCDLARFEIHTNWTNTVSQTYEIGLDELADSRKLRWLKWAFDDPEQLKPGLTRQTLTEQAAAEFARLAQRLRDRGHQSQSVAHFINRLVFCMFAEDVDLLPGKMFGRMLDGAMRSPGEFETLASSLFSAMRAGGRIGFERVDWFNGGLFDDDAALPLTRDDIALVREAADRDWAEIDPSIFGTLFERGLDPGKRSQLGAHYTDRDKIMLIVEPVIDPPLARRMGGGARRDRAAGAASRGRRRPRPRRPARAGGTAHPARQRGQCALSRLSRPAARLPRARPGLRLGQFPLSGAVGVEGHRAPRRDRGRDLGAGARVSAHRPRGGQGHRDQPLRRRIGAGDGVDRRNPMDAPQWLRCRPQPDPEAARHHRMPRRYPERRRHRS